MHGVDGAEVREEGRSTYMDGAEVREDGGTTALPMPRAEVSERG